MRGQGETVEVAWVPTAWERAVLRILQCSTDIKNFIRKTCTPGAAIVRLRWDGSSQGRRRKLSCSGHGILRRTGTQKQAKY